MDDNRSFLPLLCRRRGDAGAAGQASVHTGRTLCVISMGALSWRTRLVGLGKREPDIDVRAFCSADVAATIVLLRERGSGLVKSRVDGVAGWSAEQKGKIVDATMAIGQVGGNGVAWVTGKFGD